MKYQRNSKSNPKKLFVLVNKVKRKWIEKEIKFCKSDSFLVLKFLYFKRKAIKENNYKNLYKRCRILCASQTGIIIEREFFI